MRRSVVVLIVIFGGLGLTAGGCPGPDESALGQIKPGQTVYADLWKEDNDEGDRALVEQKPSGLWVIDTSVHFRDKREGVFDVEVTLDKTTGQFVVKNMGNTKAGYDGDDCLSVADGDHEHYATVAVTPQFDPKDVKPDPGASDDCVVLPEAA